MLPVLMILRSKIYFMRASARYSVSLTNRLYRKPEAHRSEPHKSLSQILLAAAAAVAAAGAALCFGRLALGLDARLVGVERAFGDVAEGGDALVYHVPQAHGQVVTVAAVDGHALEAVAVVLKNIRVR